MQLARTLAIARKEYIHIRRDPRSLVLIILLPVMLLLMYGYALNFDIRDVPVAVHDQDGSRVSQDLVDGFRGSRYFRLVEFVKDYARLEELFETRQARVALVIPWDFGRRIASGDTARVQVIVDGTDANTANIILGYVQAVGAAYNQRVLFERLRRLGVNRIEVPVRSEWRFWFNEDLRSINYIVPGLIVIIMTMVGALLTALTVVREVERGSMESLMATPVRKSELLLGKLAPYVVIGLVDIGITIAMGELLFGVPRRGSLLLLMGMTSLFLIATLCHGLLISVVSRTQLQAFQLGILTTFLPAFLLSGFVFSIALMPWPLQAVSYMVPARYLVRIAKGIYLKGIDLEILWPDAVMLAAAAGLFLMASLRRFAKKMA